MPRFLGLGFHLPSRSLQALNWFKKLEMQDLAFAKAPPMLVGQVISPGESALYIEIVNRLMSNVET